MNQGDIHHSIANSSYGNVENLAMAIASYPEVFDEDVKLNTGILTQMSKDLGLDESLVAYIVEGHDAAIASVVATAVFNKKHGNTRIKVKQMEVNAAISTANVGQLLELGIEPSNIKPSDIFNGQKRLEEQQGIGRTQDENQNTHYAIIVENANVKAVEGELSTRQFVKPKFGALPGKGMQDQYKSPIDKIVDTEPDLSLREIDRSVTFTEQSLRENTHEER